MQRRLTEDDREIWDRIRQSVKPLRKRRAVKPTEQAEAAVEPETKRTKAAKPARPAVGIARAPKQKTPPQPALAPLEEKTRRRLGRGLVEIDAKIDLHGMRQERAHDALVGFLRHAQAGGARIVLVVTGKGKEGGEGRGVLRYAVPNWLARPDLRELVVGFEEAGRRHGGEGALYVRIRRRRAARSPSQEA